MARQRTIPPCMTLLLLLILPFIFGYISIEKNPRDRRVIEGEDTIFTCDTSTSPEDVTRTIIHWKVKDRLINATTHKYTLSDDGKSLLIRRVTQRDSGAYTCIASVGVDQDIKTARLTVRAKPSAPEHVQVMNCLSQAAEILWQPGKNNNEEITNYIIQFNTSTDPTHWHTYHEPISPDARMAMVSLSPWGTYSFRMLSQNSLGYSEPSEHTQRTCETPPDRPDSNPENVHTVTNQKGKLIIRWTAQPKLLHNGPDFGYRVSWRPRYSVHWNKEIIKDGSVDRFEVAVGTVYAWYDLKVRAINSMGESFQPPFMKLGRSGEAEPTVVPKDFRINPTKPITSNSAHFIWEAVDSSEETIRGEFRGYRIRYWKSSEGRQQLKEVDVIMTESSNHGPDVRASLSGLPPYTALRAQVTAMNTHYTGVPSQTIEFRTSEGVPSAVRDLRVDTYADNYVILKWLKPLHPNGDVLGYDIGYQIMTDPHVQDISPGILKPNTLSVKIKGLKSRTKYKFFIWARTGPGRGDAAHVYFVTKNTEEEIRQDMPKVSLSDVGNSTINVTWTPAHTNQVVFYLLYKQHGWLEWRESNPIHHKHWRVLRKLRPNTSYQIRVVAKNGAAGDSPSEVFNVRTKGSDAIHSRYQNMDSSTPKLTHSILLIVATFSTLFFHHRHSLLAS